MNNEDSIDSTIDNQLMDASCRVALAAYLHDLGKFAERSRLDVDQEKLETHLQQYCPRQEAGGKIWHTHRHAAYTALAWDLIEKNFPELLGEDVAPFAAWGSAEVDDSVINAAARHHKPETFLQWIVATADRVASGFEREEFERYNRAEEKTATGRDHYTARQLTLFEQIRLGQADGMTRRDFRWRYPLKPMTPESLFPVEAKGYEGNDRQTAQGEYRTLWNVFTESLQRIPHSHRADWPLWLDHFDADWACHTHAIPAATAFNVRPEVSLYDHSKTTAALATALWRYHHDRKDPEAEVLTRISSYQRPDWSEEKLLLVQGDFFGIQEFIFATGAETQRQAARLLRGRSFYVALLTECAALRILEELSLPPTSQVINAAGKFLIVVPNTVQTKEKLALLQAEFDRWFLANTWGQSGIGLAWEAASCNDFLKGDGAADAPFSLLRKRLFDRLEEAKSRRFDLCGATAPEPLFEGFLDAFGRFGACAADGRSPATSETAGGSGKHISALAADQIDIGKHLAHNQRLLITSRSLDHHTLRLDIFGYYINFTGEEAATGRFGPAAGGGILRRAWDYSLPQASDEPLFSGYARRAINAYVPIFNEQNAWDRDRYRGIGDNVDFDRDPQAPKTLEHLACDDRIPDEQGNLVGARALTVLKGDVDNLGTIFQDGIERPTFAKTAALSRQINAFFSIWLPALCAQKYPDTYTVFAGGDDFFLIGPWLSTMRLAVEMRDAFRRYVAQNPEIHFSAGMVMAKPGLPIRQLGAMAEESLDSAKSFKDGEKNAVTVFGYTVSWDEYAELGAIRNELERLARDLSLSTGYIYGLQYLADMAEDLKSDKPRMDSALWNSRFAYRTRRLLERTRGLDEAARRRWQQELGMIIGGGIGRYSGAFKIPLFTYLYRPRLPLYPKTSLPIDIEGIPAFPPQNWTVVSAK